MRDLIARNAPRFIRERRLWLAITLLFMLSLAGCVPANNSNQTNQSVTNGNTNANAAPATSTAAQAVSALPVTLPVLDALLRDEAFATQLRTQLQLNDDQFNRLRTIAQTETASLSEGSGESHQGTTSEATARATEQIASVITREKMEQFNTLVRERWARGGSDDAAGGENTAANTAAPATPSGNQPNAVPTDTRIVVNAPSYRMDIFENGRLVKSYLVGIGYPEFPLPTGMRRASSIIFNPTWTPPDEPWVPRAMRGQTVQAGSGRNPLGFAKIPIGSPSLIHGGKSAARIGSFASHGCVGLTDPQLREFITMLGRVGGTPLTLADITRYTANRTQTRNVPLGRAVPVELRYETIVVEDGRLHIYRDVYDRGTNTEENLRGVLAAYNVTLEQLSEQERTQVLTSLREMARDASGRPTTGAGGQSNQNSGSARTASGRPRETRSISGRREVVIEIAALQGRGYPAPVEMNTGGAPRPRAETLRPAGASANNSNNSNRARNANNAGNANATGNANSANSANGNRRRP